MCQSNDIEQFMEEIVGRSIHTDLSVYTLSSEKDWALVSHTLSKNMIRQREMRKITPEPEYNRRFKIDKTHTGPPLPTGAVSTNKKPF